MPASDGVGPAASVPGAMGFPATRQELAGLNPADLLDQAIVALREAELLAVRLRHSHAQLGDCGSEYEQAVAAVRSAEAGLGQARGELARLRAELALARANIEALEQSRDELVAERDGLLDSTSWRVTKPLRAARKLRR